MERKHVVPAQLEQWLAEKLQDRKAKNVLRALPPPNNLIDFTSNDYLGLSRSGELARMIHAAAEKHPDLNGATGSRLLSGNSSSAEALETKLAAIFRGPAALLFNSGYAANLAVLSSIPQKGDTIIYDELAHACIKDGARLSLAKRFSFKHNNLHDLEQKIKKSQGRIFIAVESIYSMDGDECPLHALTLLAETYGATIILDEAHSTGVAGPGGAGLCVAKNLDHKIPIRIYTFGKAMGVHGACVTGSHTLIRYLINFSRPFIYTTALPPHSLTSVSCAFDYLASHMELQEQLQTKINIYLEGIDTFSRRIPSTSAIQTVLCAGSRDVRKTADILQLKGFDVRPIMYPTVPLGTERLRICLHAFNDPDAIAALTRAIRQLP